VPHAGGSWASGGAARWVPPAGGYPDPVTVMPMPGGPDRTPPAATASRVTPPGVAGVTGTVVVVDVLVVVSATTGVVVVESPVVVVVLGALVDVELLALVVEGSVVVTVVDELDVVVAGSPVPLRALRRVLSPPQVTTTVPVWGPVAVGANTTSIEQETVGVPTGHPPALREKGPVTRTSFTTTAVPVLKSSRWGSLLSPTVTEPKVRLDGESAGGEICAGAGEAIRTAAAAPATRARIVCLATRPP
jgi:hypothetical protein